jgi:hypothetical protein
MKVARDGERFFGVEIDPARPVAGMLRCGPERGPRGADFERIDELAKPAWLRPAIGPPRWVGLRCDPL